MMVVREYGVSVVVLVCVIALTVGACAGAEGGGGIALVGEQPVAAGVAPVVANFSSSVPVPGAEGPDPDPGPVRLLTEPIPPCVPLEGLDHDPCGPGVPPGLGLAALSVPISWDPPTIEEILEGLVPEWVTHIVVRATVRPGTTRCDGYLYDPFDYISTLSYSKTRAYKCFVDVRVNEYIVGAGPTELTVSVRALADRD